MTFPAATAINVGLCRGSSWEAPNAGPCFTMPPKPKDYGRQVLARPRANRKVAGLSGLRPDGMQPNHGMAASVLRLLRDWVISDRVVDVIQGHAGRQPVTTTATLTLKTKTDAIATTNLLHDLVVKFRCAGVHPTRWMSLPVIIDFALLT